MADLVDLTRKSVFSDNEGCTGDKSPPTGLGKPSLPGVGTESDTEIQRGRYREHTSEIEGVAIEPDSEERLGSGTDRTGETEHVVRTGEKTVRKIEQLKPDERLRPDKKVPKPDEWMRASPRVKGHPVVTVPYPQI